MERTESGVTELATGARYTRQKRALAELLQETTEFRSAQALHAALRDAGTRVGLTTIYNQLRGLADAGVVDTLRNAEGEVLFRRCNTNRHHHHLVCRTCGKTVEVEADGAEEWAARVAKQAGFSDVEHMIELQGTCRDCRIAERSPTSQV
jgi:Fur family ferric uptake transcriptional regulator